MSDMMAADRRYCCEKSDRSTPKKFISLNSDDTSTSRLFGSSAHKIFERKPDGCKQTFSLTASLSKPCRTGEQKFLANHVRFSLKDVMPPYLSLPRTPGGLECPSSN